MSLWGNDLAIMRKQCSYYEKCKEKKNPMLLLQEKKFIMKKLGKKERWMSLSWENVKKKQT